MFLTTLLCMTLLIVAMPKAAFARQAIRARR